MKDMDCSRSVSSALSATATRRSSDASSSRAIAVPFSSVSRRATAPGSKTPFCSTNTGSLSGRFFKLVSSGVERKDCKARVKRARHLRTPDLRPEFRDQLNWDERRNPGNFLDARSQPEIHSAGAVFRSDTVIALTLQATRPSDRPSVADAAQAMLGQWEATP